MNAISKEPRRRSRSRRLKAAVAVAVAALVPTMLSTTPAEGTVVNVAEGHNITVFHNIDFVAVFGYSLGEELTVEVFRNDAHRHRHRERARARHPRSDSRSTTAPRVRPSPATAGRAARRTSAPVTASSSRRRPASTRSSSTGSGSTARARATRERRHRRSVQRLPRQRHPDPPAFIDSAEFRAASNNQVRFEGNVLVERRPGALPGQLRMRYRSPFRPARNRPLWNQAQLRRALLGDGHAIGFGHVEVLPARACSSTA